MKKKVVKGFKKSAEVLGDAARSYFSDGRHLNPDVGALAAYDKTWPLRMGITDVNAEDIAEHLYDLKAKHINLDKKS